MNPGMPYRLFYYEHVTEQEITPLKQVAKDLYDYLEDVAPQYGDTLDPEINAELHRLIWQYDRTQHAGVVEDKMHYAANNSVSLQTRLEENTHFYKFNQRQATNTTLSGLPLEEINTYEQTIKAKKEDDEMSFAIKDRYRSSYSKGEAVRLQAVEGERLESHGDVKKEFKAPVNMHTVEDANGHVTDILSNTPDDQRHAIINSGQCVVFKNASQVKAVSSAIFRKSCSIK